LHACAEVGLPAGEGMARGLITLLTDFGTGSHYVAVMKGVILGINPAARIMDVTHAVPPQDVQQGAWVLAEVARWFPPETVHAAVVDPGVGTQRRLVYAAIGGQHFVAPDNGLLSLAARRSPPAKLVTLAEPRYWLPEVSATFHGRDIIAPVAAWLSRGLEPDLLGPPQASLTPCEWPEVIQVPGTVEGCVQSVDSFGNLITNITAEMLRDAPRDERVRIECEEHETLGIYRTYADQPPQTFIALIGSSGFLELAVVNDNAAKLLGIGRGAVVRVRW